MHCKSLGRGTTDYQFDEHRKDHEKVKQTVIQDVGSSFPSFSKCQQQSYLALGAQ